MRYHLILVRTAIIKSLQIINAREGVKRKELETWMQVKKQQLELDMKQGTCSKLGKEYDKPIYCHFSYLTKYRVHHAKWWTG